MNENSFKALDLKFKSIDNQADQARIKFNASFSFLNAKINENLQQEIIENVLQDRREFLLKQLNHKRDESFNQIDKLENSILTRSRFQLFNFKLNFINNYINTSYVNKKASKINKKFVLFKPSSLNFEIEELFGKLDFSRPFDSLEAFKYIHLLASYLSNNSQIHNIDHEHFKLKHNVSECDAFFQLSYDRYFFFTTISKTSSQMFITKNKFELKCSKVLHGVFLNKRIRYENEKIYVFYAKSSHAGMLYVCKIYDTGLNFSKKLLISFEHRIKDIKSVVVHNNDVCVQFKNFFMFYNSFKAGKREAYKIIFYNNNTKVIGFNHEQIFLYNFFNIKIFSRIDAHSLNKINVYDCFYFDPQYSLKFDFELCYIYLFNRHRVLVFDSDGKELYKNEKFNSNDLDLLLALTNSKCMRNNFLTNVVLED